MLGPLMGDGQYGSVYECIGPFDQRYALKMFRPFNKSYEAVRDEWVQEMRRLQNYRHPNIVYIHDAFEDHFLFYLALERCDTSLRAILGRPFAVDFLIEISRQLLMSLQYLHDNGLVHADLHAGNVLITQLQQDPVVKLTDFGVSHQLDTNKRWFRPTVANPKILTPELITLGYTTTQSDLYQLGLLMFQMHTGYPAVDPNASYQEISNQIANGSPRKMAESLGTPLGAVIAKMLRRRDAFRYFSARDLWDDLRQLR